MLKMNNKMKSLLYNININQPNKISKNVEKICNEIVSKTKIIFNCVVHDPNDELKEKNLNKNYVINDTVRYESNCNEFRPIDYFDYHCEFTAHIVHYTLYHLKIKLKDKYPNRKFCIIISISDKISTVHFHTCINNEDLWISNNLDNFEDPVLYEIF